VANKEIRELVKELREQGWDVDESGRHIRAYPPDKSRPMVTIAKTPSGPRWRANTIAQLRRSGFRG
jgi:hypothetical protein